MKKINGDYLWDKTGEPDPEIQQLEQVLGTLRYQPRSLDIPAGVAPPGHKRSFTPRLLAIAATIAMLLLGVGLWLGLQRQQTTTVSKVPDQPVATPGGNQTEVGVPYKDNGPDKDSGQSAIDRGGKPLRQGVNPGLLSRDSGRNRRTTLNRSELSARDRIEGEAAKAQLMLALRVASSKLSFAQKKAQEINTQNQSHNQHKIG